jgi:hypothetical protein
VGGRLVGGKACRDDVELRRGILPARSVGEAAEHLHARPCPRRRVLDRQWHPVVRLMKKYRDTPMDDADATLVLLAADLSVADILTLDRRGFSTYRPPNGRAFRLAGL